VALYLNKLEISSPKGNMYQVLLILAWWFWRRFLEIFCVFLLFCYYLPLERGYSLPLKTLKSSPSKDDLCQVWLKLAQWFWRKKNLNDHIPFLLFCYYLPWPFIWTNLNSLHPRIICTKFGWFWPAGSGEDF
jgi:hypothetical protein